MVFELWSNDFFLFSEISTLESTAGLPFGLRGGWEYFISIEGGHRGFGGGATQRALAGGQKATKKEKNQRKALSVSFGAMSFEVTPLKTF